MAERDVVRITFKEIQSIADSFKEERQDENKKKDNSQRKKSRRPEQAIYRPGQMRFTRKEKDSGSSRGEQEEGRPTEEENWEAELEADTHRDAQSHVTTDEDSIHSSKENSVEKEVGSNAGVGSGDGSACQDTALAPSLHLQKDDTGRRKSKRPDIQIYVPKGRLQEHEAGDVELGTDVSGGDVLLASCHSDVQHSSTIKELSSQLEGLLVSANENPPLTTVTMNQESPAKPPKVPSPSVSSKGRHSKKCEQKEEWHVEVFADSQDDETCSENTNVHPQSSHRSGLWDSTAPWRGKGRGRHSEDRDYHFRTDQSAFGGKDDKDSLKSGGGRGRGRGRGGSLYPRSSSNESLTRSLDLGHGQHWPGERDVIQQSGTFPRSKGGKGRGQIVESSESPQNGTNKHTFTSMRPQRERSGSFSSDTSGGSDLSWEDLEAEYEREKPDWNTQVEQYLEEMARQVHDSTQRLTDNIDSAFLDNPTADSLSQPPCPSTGQPLLSRNLSASSDHIFTQEYRGRKKDRRHKGSHSKNSSRDSSAHSNPHGDDQWQASEEKRFHRRRNRRRHSSAGPAGRDGGAKGSATMMGTLEGQRAAESLRIMVGKNKDRRQVIVKGANADVGGSGGGVSGRTEFGELGGQHREGPRARQQQERQDRGGPTGQRLDQRNQHPERSGKNRDGKVAPPPLYSKEVERAKKEERKSQPVDSTVRVGGSAEKRNYAGQGMGSKVYGASKSDRQRHNSQPKQHDAEADERSQVIESRRLDGKKGQQQGRHQQGAGMPDARKQGHPFSAAEHKAATPLPHTAGLLKIPAEAPSDRSAQAQPRAMRGQGHWQDWATNHNQDAKAHSQGHGYDRNHSTNSAHHEQFEDRFRRSSGSGGERHLFDPKNPSKPIMVPDVRPLKFHDPEEAHSLSPHEGAYTPPPPPPQPQLHPRPHSPSSSANVMPMPSFPPFFPPYMYGPPPPPAPHMQMPFPGYGPGPCPTPRPHPMFFSFQPPGPGLGDVDDGYYYRETEQMVSGMSRPQCRIMAEQILRDAVPLDCQLTNILSRGPLSEDAQRRVKQLRQELQRRYERVLLLDIDVANQRGVEQQLWRSVYYNVIEGLRHHHNYHQQQEQHMHGSSDALVEILDEGTAFYESLLGKLQATYDFNLDTLLEEGGVGSEGASRGMRLALLSAQRTMMFLGDIARYREQSAQTTNYGKARQWYIRAQRLAPKNGRPYNQLAILAMYTRRKLDAVYYYQRSLAASNPILTARESLMSLFDEIRRKEEAVEQKRLEEARSRRHQRKTASSHSQPRVELWIAADGSSSRDNQSDHESDLDDLCHLSSVELNKRFVLTFLNVHGKLFTKINFEVFVESVSLMLHEWRLLLQHSSTVLNSTRLVQIMAINMFSIDNTVLKDESLESSYRSLLQDHSVETALDMFGLLVAYVNQLLTLHVTTTITGAALHQPLGEDVRQLLPGVKCWVDWMMCHSSLWNPQPSLRPPDMGPQVDLWRNVADLCNTLKLISTSHIALHRNKAPGCEPLVLMEDSMLAGFVPLLSAPVDSVYVSSTDDKEMAMDCLRLEKVVLFGEYLCGIEPPMLSFDVQKSRYFSVAPAPVKSEERLVDTEGNVFSESEDVIVESEESGEDGDETPGETIKELKARKAELRQRVESQARDKQSLQNLVEQQTRVKLEIEVHPRFLVTDTNCFIDHISALRSLVAVNSYTLIIPLVVLNELEGLAKGAARGTERHLDNSPEHIAMVTRHAQQALNYIESEYKARNIHVRVQTSKGSILDSLAFRSEECNTAGNNDDLILSCCLHYCKDMARDFMPKDKDSPVHLFRDVVLLTDDRNLRLKAHTSNVPVKDVPAFCHWSRIT